MNVILFGYGKMGKYIYQSLKKYLDPSKIYIVDPVFDKNSLSLNQFRQFNEIPSHIRFDAAFIATNSMIHCDVLKQVIGQGIFNIFCEKPMCLTKKEYQEIQRVLPKNARLIADYILRSSPTIPIWKKEIIQALQGGYHIQKCLVQYCKDTRQDPRRFHDIGLYEDMYHVWDLCLNGSLFDNLSAVWLLESMHLFSSEIKNRCVEQHIICRLKMQKYPLFDLKIKASFQADQLNRSFVCVLKKGKEKKEVSLVFDQNGKDKCLITQNGQFVYEEVFRSHNKLNIIIRDSLTYFKTGQRPLYAHGIQDSVHLHNYLNLLRQAPPSRCRQKSKATKHLSQ